MTQFGPKPYGQSVLDAMNSGQLTEASPEFYALKNLQGDVGKFVRLEGSAVQRSWTGTDRVVWRSDSRSPDVIFKCGFTTWDSAPPNHDRYNLAGAGIDRSTLKSGDAVVKPADRVPMFRTGKGDIDCDTGVCVAVDLRGAAFFPLNIAVRRPWMYACIVRQGIDTHAIQKALGGDEVWSFQERVNTVIAGHDVFCAVQFERQMFAVDEPPRPPSAPNSTAAGIRFRLDRSTITWNPDVEKAKMARRREKNQKRLAAGQAGFTSKEAAEAIVKFRAKLETYKNKVLEDTKKFPAWYPVKDHMYINLAGEVKSADQIRQAFS